MRPETGGQAPRAASPPTTVEGASGTPSPTVGSLGDRVWLVLGGGGLKGLSHVGAWRALGEAGLEVAGIVGTSIGSLVGALAASGATWKEMRAAARSLERTDIVRINRKAVLFNGIRQVSVFRGDALREYYGRILPGVGWDSLRIPLLVNAVDLATGKTVWFGPGARTDVPLADALYASSALPVLYPPFILDGKALVDGGTGQPLALGRAAEAGATGIVGVDVGAGEEADADRIIRQGMLAVHQRIFSIMTYRLRREAVRGWEGPPLLYVRPRLDGYGAFDFQHVEYFVEEGYRAASLALGSATQKENGPARP